jgi:hypothetical protein
MASGLNLGEVEADLYVAIGGAEGSAGFRQQDDQRDDDADEELALLSPSPPSMPGARVLASPTTATSAAQSSTNATVVCRAGASLARRRFRPLRQRQERLRVTKLV